MIVLLRDCLEDRFAEAWSEFFYLYVQVTDAPLRRFVRTFGGNDQDAEDLAMDVLVSLCGDSCRKLRSFRGESRAQLAAWLRRVALNYARNWVKSKLRRSRHVQIADLEFWESTDGVTEEEVAGLVQELAELATRAGSPFNINHIERLGLLAGLQDGADELSDRTIRHWKQDLANRLSAVLAH